jgi:ECF sigma factor
MSEVTRILLRIEHGDQAAAERLLPLVYDELRKLAAVKLAQERAKLTLRPGRNTLLVNTTLVLPQRRLQSHAQAYQSTSNW